jgi:indole-3-glycerol phosphate synthase
MNSFLESIIENKKREIGHLPDFQKAGKSLYSCLIESNNTIIAEIKRRSPALGRFTEISLSQQVQAYVRGGAQAISVLTDHVYFSGSIEDLRVVSGLLSDSPIPVLRKDFIVDIRQLYEAKMAGADVVLLIVAVLGERLKEFVELAHQIGLEALVEIHTEEECAIALDTELKMLAVNNRNLHDFKVDVGVSHRLISLIPSHIPCVSASGISTQNQIEELQQAGYRGFLIGEALMKCTRPEILLRAFL